MVSRSIILVKDFCISINITSQDLFTRFSCFLCHCSKVKGKQNALYMFMNIVLMFDKYDYLGHKIATHTVWSTDNQPSTDNKQDKLLWIYSLLRQLSEASDMMLLLLRALPGRLPSPCLRTTAVCTMAARLASWASMRCIRSLKITAFILNFLIPNKPTSFQNHFFFSMVRYFQNFL